MKKKLPNLKSDRDKAKFWESNQNVLDYFDEDDFKVVNPHKNRIENNGFFVMHLNSVMINNMKKISGQRKVNYQKLLEKWIKLGIENKFHLK